MLIFNLLAMMAFAFEIFMYVVLGINLFPKPQISDNSSPAVDSAPYPTYYAPTTAAAKIMCELTASGDNAADCPTCLAITSSETIQSPNYANDYNIPEFKAECTYDFTADTGKKVQIVIAKDANFYLSGADPADYFAFKDTVTGTYKASTAIVDDAEDTTIQTYPTAAELTYMTSDTKGQVKFISRGNPCIGTTPCQWSFTVSAV